MRRLPLLASVAAIGLVMFTVTALLHERREEEWAHGGDAVTVDVGYRVAGKDDATEAARALDWPVGSFDGSMAVFGDQALVVRVSWSGAPRDGRFNLIALDRRYTPPQVLHPNYGHDASGRTGSEWGSGFDVLAERYDWLAGTAQLPDAGDDLLRWDRPMAVGTPAAPTGTVMALFDLGRGGLPTEDPARDLMLALVYSDDGVRWARQVALPQPADFRHPR